METTEGRDVFINVGAELREHYECILKVRDEVVADYDAGGSQKAAVLNTTTTIIRELASIQKELYTSGRIALLQDAIVQALEEADESFKSRVIEILEERLARLDG